MADWLRDATGYIIGAVGFAFAGLLALVLHYERRDRDRYDKGIADNKSGIDKLSAEIAILTADVVTHTELDTLIHAQLKEANLRFELHLTASNERLEAILERLEKGSRTRHNIDSNLQALVGQLTFINRVVANKMGLELPDLKLPEIKHED